MHKSVYPFAKIILADNGQFNTFNLKDLSLSSTHKHFFLDSLSYKRFGTEEVYIYETGVIRDTAPRYLLIVKVDDSKIRGCLNLMPLLVIGRTHKIAELETLYLFFSKYNFPSSIKSKCYEILLGSAYDEAIRGGDKVIEIDSLFPNSN